MEGPAGWAELSPPSGVQTRPRISAPVAFVQAWGRSNRREPQWTSWIACRQLAAMDRPYLFGSNTAWRARIAAVLEDRDQAVALLRQAYREGQSFGL